MDIQPLLIVGAGLLRSLAGWAKHSLQDGKIDDLEWKQLGATIVRVGVLGLVIAYIPGFDISWIEVGACAIGSDIVLEIVKKFRK